MMASVQPNEAYSLAQQEQVRMEKKWNCPARVILAVAKTNPEWALARAPPPYLT